MLVLILSACSSNSNKELYLEAQKVIIKSKISELDLNRVESK